MPSQLPLVLPDINVYYVISSFDATSRTSHRVVWTDDVLEELVEVWVRNGARSKATAGAIVDQIRATFEEQQIARSDSGHLIPEVPGPDEDDHVHAAAAMAVAPSILLTANTKDFPPAELKELGVTVRHRDDYFVDLLTAEPGGVRDVDVSR